MKVRLFAIMTSVVFILAACAPAATPTPTVVPTAAPTEVMPKDIVDIAIEDGRFTTLVAAVQAAGLVDTLKSEGPFTVFAPTDDAFAALPAGTLESLLLPENKQQLTDILLYHVVSGEFMEADVVGLDGQMVDTALDGKQITIKLDNGVYLNDTVKVILTDIVASNGVIHVIDTVLLPKDDTSMDMPKDIVDIAIEDGRFTTLVAAVQAAGLVDTLKSEGPFTVFAPTDDAFAALPAGTLESLLLPENKQQLTDILLYHVVSGKFMEADVVGLDGQMVDTALDGKQITIKLDNGVYLNGAVKVILTDIVASNGVIHVIDAVLLP